MNVCGSMDAIVDRLVIALTPYSASGTLFFTAMSCRPFLQSRLEPSFVFFHTPRSAAHPLSLYLMELFRVPLWDMPLVASVNRQQWNPDEDFTYAGAQVWLSDKSRPKAIEVYERQKKISGSIL